MNALLCKFTMGQAMNNWNRYWEVVLHNGGGNIMIDTRAKDRFEKYMKRIKEAVARAEEEEVMWLGKVQEGKNNNSRRGGSISPTSHRTVNEL